MMRKDDAREILVQALRANGIVDSARLESHLLGCDFTQPVTEHLLEAGETFIVWTRNGGVPGKYAAPPNEQPERLGIMMDHRHPEVFRVLTPILVVRSTAAIFSTGVVDLVGGLGGGVQYLLPPNWNALVERVKS